MYIVYNQHNIYNQHNVSSEITDEIVKLIISVISLLPVVLTYYTS